MTTEKALAILNHLNTHGLAFCFLESTGELVSREACEKILSKICAPSSTVSLISPS